jgi:hypothetical protein
MAGEQSKKAGKKKIAGLPKQRHFGLGVQPASEYDVRMFVPQRSGEVGEEAWIASSVSIKKSEKLGIRSLPGVLDGCTVASIFFENN